MKRRYKSKPRRRTYKRRSRRRSRASRIVRNQPSLKHFVRVPVRKRWPLILPANNATVTVAVHRFLESFDDENELKFGYNGAAFDSFRRKWE